MESLGGVHAWGGEGVLGEVVHGRDPMQLESSPHNQALFWTGGFFRWSGGAGWWRWRMVGVHGEMVPVEVVHGEMVHVELVHGEGPHASEELPSQSGCRHALASCCLPK